ncbi:MAG TPA: endonuclease/exonuclease/phosphatase family protein [Oryzihumus sp.]|nr:endonuclease/exonuclease/phosphatase family protein [Oryzihumus sp.]
MTRAALRVATWNVHDLKDDVEAAVRVVRAVDPDVLCLQEVPRRPFSGRRVAGFAQQCGLNFAGRHRGSGGTTVLTRPSLDLHDSRHEGLPVAPLQRERGYAVAQVALPGHRPLTVASFHLGLDPLEREHHLLQLLSDVGPSEALVVAGDLNEVSTGRAWRTLASRLPQVSPDRPTFSARHPRLAIDGVFASLPALPDDPVPAPDPADLVRASDHLPVWADLDVSRLVMVRRG